MNEGSAEEDCDPLQEALGDLAHLANATNSDAGEVVRQEARNRRRQRDALNLRELRFRLKRDVLLEVRRLCETNEQLDSTCRQLAAMPPSRSAFDSKCDLLYCLAQQHPHLRAIFAHYNDLRSALQRSLYAVDPAQTDRSDLLAD